MSRFSDIDPSDIDPETGRPYAGYSSPSLDTSFHDGEMDQEDSAASIIEELARMVEYDPEFQAEEAADALNTMIERARAVKAKAGAA